MIFSICSIVQSSMALFNKECNREEARRLKSSRKTRKAYETVTKGRDIQLSSYKSKFKNSHRHIQTETVHRPC